MARLAEDLAKASGATVAHQLGSARDWGKELPGSMTGAVGLADRLYAQGKRAAADRRVQQVAATLATLAVTAVIRRHPAGALASSAWSMIEAIAQSDAFRRGRAAAPGWQGAVARAAGQHTWKRIGQKGGFATFTYVDVNGVVTERLVRDWRSTGRLIRGHCLLRNGYRSFRIDRIDDWNQPRQEGR
jgi:predicted DNA-binding transcriptional regulator YafY